jgi:hypothetical protein
VLVLELKVTGLAESWVEHMALSPALIVVVEPQFLMVTPAAFGVPLLTVIAITSASLFPFWMIISSVGLFDTQFVVAKESGVVFASAAFCTCAGVGMTTACVCAKDKAALIENIKDAANNIFFMVVPQPVKENMNQIIIHEREKAS